MVVLVGLLQVADLGSTGQHTQGISASSQLPMHPGMPAGR